MIADQLNAEHLLTRRGNYWTNAEIWRIIRESAYMGEAYYGRRAYFTKDDKKHMRVSPRENWIPVKFPAIVDEMLWNRAQAIRERNARLNAKNGSNLSFALHGLQ